MTAHRIASLLLAASAASALLTGCNSTGSTESASGNGQGWDGEAQERWSAATQGSRLMPLAWFKALAQPGGTASFADNDYLATFRIVTRRDALPVGFAVDEGADDGLTFSSLRWFEGQENKEKWVGLNCAACHTAVIEVEGKEHRIDGGPSLFDYQSFIEALDKSLHETLASADAADPAAQTRFTAFAQKVLCKVGQPCLLDTAKRGKLRDALASLVAWEDKVEEINKTTSRYGFGRVDAFGHIFNKVALFNGAANPTPNPASAPVSYPYIWGIWQHKQLQYNGIASNARFANIDYGAMGRNAGEVLGVFGDIKVEPNAGLKGYVSSVNVANLERLERLLSTLKPPVWPAALGDVSAGKALYEGKCLTCHQPKSEGIPFDVSLIPLKQGEQDTDQWMACNAVRYQSPAGLLAGTPEAYIGSGPVYGPGPASNAGMLATMVKGALVGKKGAILAQAGRVFIGVGGLPVVVEDEGIFPVDPIIQACYDAKSPLMQYKARPLEGIWATAPYLHNGSVPSLYQLLLPPEQRVKTFYVGTRLYDAANVGYRTDAQASGNGFLFDTSLPGNGNFGHVYGADRMTEAQRQALLAYMKTL